MFDDCEHFSFFSLSVVIHSMDRTSIQLKTNMDIGNMCIKNHNQKLITTAKIRTRWFSAPTFPWKSHTSPRSTTRVAIIQRWLSLSPMCIWARTCTIRTLITFHIMVASINTRHRTISIMSISQASNSVRTWWRWSISQRVIITWTTTRVLLRTPQHRPSTISRHRRDTHRTSSHKLSATSLHLRQWYWWRNPLNWRKLNTLRQDWNIMRQWSTLIATIT